MKTSAYIITVSFLTFSLPLSAEFDASNVLCNNVKFSTCMNVNKNKCITAKIKSEATCLKKHPINLDAEKEESFKTAKNYGQCFTNNFIANLDTDKNKFEQCVMSSNLLKDIETIMKNKHNEN